MVPGYSLALRGTGLYLLLWVPSRYPAPGNPGFRYSSVLRQWFLNSANRTAYKNTILADDPGAYTEETNLTF